MGFLIYKGRPEDILISKQNASNSIKAKIDIIEPKGREFEIHLDLGEKILIAVLRKLDSFNIGNEVYFTFYDKKIRLFDKNTEKNIFASNYNDYFHWNKRYYFLFHSCL